MSEQFRIPKISVPIICHTVEGEKIRGEFFLDAVLSHEYSASQVLDYFNDSPPFFPLRIAGSTRPILLRKDSLVQIDVPQLIHEFKEEPSANLIIKRDAVLYSHGLGPIHATVLMDLPDEYSRILDLLNLRKNFFPAVVNETFCLLNANHIYKVEELSNGETR